MLRCFSFLLLVLLSCFVGEVFAQAKSEKAHVSFILASMQSQNKEIHSRLYAPFDTLFAVLEKHPIQNEVQNLRNDLRKLQQFDPAFNPEIGAAFDTVIKKGADSGLHWREIILAGYELKKVNLTRDLIGLDKIMDTRFQGYIFVEDMLTRRRYGITVKEIACVKGNWYGGRLINVLEADNIDQYLAKLAIEEKKRLHPELFPVIVDTNKKSGIVVNEDDEDEDEKPRRDIVERIYYKGVFDNTIPVELYIRGKKGTCPAAVCSWDAIYRFADQDDYLKLEVSKTPDGKWLLTEEPDVGSMELVLNNGEFTGTWTSLKDRTEYEVNFTEKKEVRSRKLFEMDDVIENELWAK
jgi:hypothetical protein